MMPHCPVITHASAALSSIGAGLGIMCRTVAATLGLALVLQTSPVAFWVVKAVGAAYLFWLGYKALTLTPPSQCDQGQMACCPGAGLTRRTAG